MDTLRSAFDSGESADTVGLAADRAWDALDEESAELAERRDLPPEAIGQDERRMQVRAYNHWASLLGERMFPRIDDLDPDNLPDFGPNSVLLDFSHGIDNPAVRFLGNRLARECSAGGVITRLSDVPPRSLLSRITDHYMQILANQAPIGFEAEFVNQRGVAILYRGILLPYSSNDDTIDYIYGVINWKEMADQLTADELLLEIDQALDLSEEAELAPESRPRAADPLTDWADSPAHESADEPAIADDLSLSDFSQFTLDDDEEYDEDEGDGDSAGYNFASLADYIEAPVKKAIDPADFIFDPALDEAINDEAEHSHDESVADNIDADFADEDLPVSEVLPTEAGLHDYLASARELARTADTTEDRSRCALYAAVSRAYDFSLAAQAAPDDYAELIAEAGLAVQDRAPMTPVVKLVFGHDYDKTRLTEYAAVLTHAHRLQLGHGSLADFLSETDGGLKAVVKAERRLRREEQGKEVEDEASVRAALAEKLRALEAMTLEALDGAGPEFALVLIRRDEIGCAEVLGELPEDIGLIERAARKLVG